MCGIGRKKMPPTQDLVVGAQVSASPRYTPGRTGAPHRLPRLEGKKRLCALVMLELPVSATSGALTPPYGALDGACQ
jgi:hypothetical protein